MSGTSLDGLDIALCNFNFSDEKLHYEIIAAKTVEYPTKIIEILNEAINTGSLRFNEIHNEYGKWIGHQVNEFIQNHKVSVDLISSHGHTIFHKPDEGFTVQIGSGAQIAAITNITTVCDFRSLDVALGGQGAPLVPVGDKLLFTNYNACINIGGFANISLDFKDKRIAWDICPANFVLNYYANKLGKSCDIDGNFAKSGKIIPVLLNSLNELPYYFAPPPKSLGREWVESNIFQLIDSQNLKPNDILCTFTNHIAGQIVKSIPNEYFPGKSVDVLFSGGGVKNKFLTELITQMAPFNIIVPSAELIDYKEALVFALLGVLRVREEHNCLKEVTGARTNNSGGCIYRIC